MQWNKPPMGVPINGSQRLADGLAASLLFNEGGGGVAKDAVQGTETSLLNFANPPTAASGWGPGYESKGLVFDGVAASDSLDVLNLWPHMDGNEGTVIFRFLRLFPFDLDVYLFEFRADSSNRFSLRVSTGANDRWWWQREGSGVDPIVSQIDNDGWLFPRYEWRTVAMTFSLSESVLRGYVEGIEVDSNGPLGAFVGDPEGARLGSNQGGTQNANIVVDYLHIYNRALSPREIAYVTVRPFAMYEWPRIEMWVLAAVGNPWYAYAQQ